MLNWAVFYSRVVQLECMYYLHSCPPTHLLTYTSFKTVLGLPKYNIVLTWPLLRRVNATSNGGRTANVGDQPGKPRLLVHVPYTLWSWQDSSPQWSEESTRTQEFSNHNISPKLTGKNENGFFSSSNNSSQEQHSPTWQMSKLNCVTSWTLDQCTPGG